MVCCVHPSSGERESGRPGERWNGTKIDATNATGWAQSTSSEYFDETRARVCVCVQCTVHRVYETHVICESIIYYHLAIVSNQTKGNSFRMHWSAFGFNLMRMRRIRYEIDLCQLFSAAIEWEMSGWMSGCPRGHTAHPPATNQHTLR